MIENNESPTHLRSVPPELEAVLRRKGYILLVKGDAGTGKTNLALELMALLHSEGDSVHISTRTYPEKLSFQHSLFAKLAAEPNVQFFSTLEFDPTQFVVGHKVISGLHDLLSSMENPLVVLDSWEGISDYIPAEARMKVEQSLMAVLEETGARLILVSEHSEANTTLDQLADAIASNLASYGHPTATAPMGGPQDPWAVVDSHGAVKGIDGLRVVDASIMPVVPSVALNPTTIMIAERIAKALYASETRPIHRAVQVAPTA